MFHVDAEAKAGTMTRKTAAKMAAKELNTLFIQSSSTAMFIDYLDGKWLSS
ncbi:hypothetical protein GPEL0_01f2596 [Geoanaerobacter pelophilus]|uniref:Uncharacterized protein n=1 Tax=Geoanaerobacter pelophilus TaxID=60036 RepID=A0ABQ0MIU0_9BACT|nr:hypothetical protein GPEL0_01f2596 [Geoanaerobacter pelophilus]